MPSAVESLILDLLEWIGPAPRPYAEVMAAWRTTCPGLPVWEEAIERGFIAIRQERGEAAGVERTPRGEEHLRRHRTSPVQQEVRQARER